MSDLEKALLETVVTGIAVIHPYQVGKGLNEAAEVKVLDKTLVTAVDHECEMALINTLRTLLPDIPVLGEEGGLVGYNGKLENYTGQYLALVDPLDGTYPFVTGAPTSTIMVGIYDRHAKQVVASAIGLPATGLVWASIDGTCQMLAYDTATLRSLDKPSARHVWQGAFAHKAGIHLDLSQAFARKDIITGEKYDIYSDSQIQKLIQNILQIGKLQMYGSNGMHQVLVANGGEYAAGSIGTAGGPWDHLGALLVANAGGALAGYRIVREDDSRLEPCDPLDALVCDFLITAHSDETLSLLKECFEKSRAT